MQEGVCKLCLKHRELITKSHIIPDFMYKGMRNSQNQMFAMSLVNEQLGRDKVVQTGYYDKFVLCEICDNVVLGSLDGYVNCVIYGGVELTMKNGKSADGQLNFTLISGINYKKYKLFLLSVLWRAHISSNKFFQYINLGEEAEKIRSLIYNNSIVDEEVYKISIFALKVSETELVRSVINPYHYKTNGFNFCTFIINGFVYFFNLQKTDYPSLFAQTFLRNTGEVELPVLTPEQSQMLLKGYFQRLNK